MQNPGDGDWDCSGFGAGSSFKQHRVECTQNHIQSRYLLRSNLVSVLTRVAVFHGRTETGSSMHERGKWPRLPLPTIATIQVASSVGSPGSGSYWLYGADEGFVSFGFVWFRFVWFRFVWFRFVSFRFILWCSVDHPPYRPRGWDGGIPPRCATIIPN